MVKQTELDADIIIVQAALYRGATEYDTTVVFAGTAQMLNFLSCSYREQRTG